MYIRGDRFNFIYYRYVLVHKFIHIFEYKNVLYLFTFFCYHFSTTIAMYVNIFVDDGVNSLFIIVYVYCY